MESLSIFSMNSPERALSRRAWTCTVSKDCATCNCPARAKVACILLQRSPAEFLDVLEMPPELASLIRRLPRDVFEFESWENWSWHRNITTFYHPLLHKLKEGSDDEL